MAGRLERNAYARQWGANTKADSTSSRRDHLRPHVHRRAPSGGPHEHAHPVRSDLLLTIVCSRGGHIGSSAFLLNFFGVTLDPEASTRARECDMDSNTVSTIIVGLVAALGTGAVLYLLSRADW